MTHSQSSPTFNSKLFTKDDKNINCSKGTKTEKTKCCFCMKKKLHVKIEMCLSAYTNELITCIFLVLFINSNISAYALCILVKVN